MGRCFVDGCKSNSRCPQGLHFFRVPKNWRHAHQWLKALGKNENLIIANQKVCSLHFKINEIIKVKQRTVLMEGAVPTLVPVSLTEPGLSISQSVNEKEQIIFLPKPSSQSQEPEKRKQNFIILNKCLPMTTNKVKFVLKNVESWNPKARKNTQNDSTNEMQGDSPTEMQNNTDVSYVSGSYTKIADHINIDKDHTYSGWYNKKKNTKPNKINKNLKEGNVDEDHSYDGWSNRNKYIKANGVNEKSQERSSETSVDNDHLFEESEPSKTHVKSLQANSCCRICLEIPKQKVKFEKPILKMLIDCVPFMEPFITNEHFLCLQCLLKLQTSYSFTQACLKAKKKFLKEQNVDFTEETINIQIDENITNGTCTNAENDLEYMDMDGTNRIKVDFPEEIDFSEEIVENECSLDDEDINNERYTSVVENEVEYIDGTNFLNNSIENDGNYSDSNEENEESSKNNSDLCNLTKNSYLNEENNVNQSSANEFLENGIFQNKIIDYLDLPLVNTIEENINPELFNNVDDYGSIINEIEISDEKISLPTISKEVIENKEELKVKEKMEKLGKTKIECPTCQEVFEIDRFLVTHSKKCKLEKLAHSVIKGCKHCSLALPQHRIQAHFNKEHSASYCDICMTVFETTELLVNHLEENHKFPCGICGKRSDTDEDFIDHITKHARRNKHRTLVNKILEEKNLPIIEKPSSKVHICHVCGKCFDNVGLCRHMKVHSTEKVKCKICNMSLKMLSLSNHIKAIHGPKSFICEVCGKSFKKSANLKLHKNSHGDGVNKFNCDKCDQVFVTKSRLYGHEIRIHRIKYECEKCQGKFAKRENYEAHCQSDCMKNNYKGNTKCEICFKVLATKYMLAYHLESHAAKAESCKLCGKKFKHQRRLRAHMLYHKKKYVCDFCGLISTSQGNLNKHKKVHNDEKPHRCNICWLRFYTLEELNQHVGKHDDSKKYKCDECGEKFNRFYLLQNHKNGVHPEKNTAVV